MDIAVCGLNCDACKHLGTACSGPCRNTGGRVFWAEPAGLPACPIFSCAAPRRRGERHGEG